MVQLKKKIKRLVKFAWRQCKPCTPHRKTLPLKGHTPSHKLNFCYLNLLERWCHVERPSLSTPTHPLTNLRYLNLPARWCHVENPSLNTHIPSNKSGLPEFAKKMVPATHAT